MSTACLVFIRSGARARNVDGRFPPPSLPLFLSISLSLSLSSPSFAFTQIKALPPIRSSSRGNPRYSPRSHSCNKGSFNFPAELAVVRALAILANRATLTSEVHPCDICMRWPYNQIFRAARTFDSKICRLYTVAVVDSVTAIERRPRVSLSPLKLLQELFQRPGERHY